jgi:hypothetical protein
MYVVERKSPCSRRRVEAFSSLAARAKTGVEAPRSLEFDQSQLPALLDLAIVTFVLFVSDHTSHYSSIWPSVRAEIKCASLCNNYDCNFRIKDLLHCHQVFFLLSFLTSRLVTQNPSRLLHGLRSIRRFKFETVAMPKDDPAVTVQLFAVVREHITFDKYSFPPHKLSCLDLHCLSIVICARLFSISIISSTKASSENHEPDIVYFHLTMGQKSVLITGSSEGGIGDALARTFHKKGLRVFATARNLTKVQHLKELGLEILPLDVTDGASIKQAVESVKAATGGTLDILVNNSGGGKLRLN